MSRPGDAPNEIPIAAPSGAPVISGDTIPSPITPYVICQLYYGNIFHNHLGGHFSYEHDLVHLKKSNYFLVCY